MKVVWDGGVGYDATVATDADGPRWCLISLSDGMVQPAKHRIDLAAFLTMAGELPVELFDPNANGPTKDVQS